MIRRSIFAGMTFLLALLVSCGALNPGGNSERSGEGGCPPPDDSSWPTEHQALECDLLTLVNEQRSKGASCGSLSMAAVPPLIMHAKLRTAGRGHAQNMADQDFFAHREPNGRQAEDRVDAAGYSWSAVGENIAAGSATARKTMDQWVNSPGHCENIMDPTYQHIGIGYAASVSSTHEHYWVQTFGRPL